jgi:hypothetical protein
MATNTTVFPVDGPAVIYFQDGSSTTVAAQEEKSFQIVEGGFCTISDPPDSDDLPAFVEAMIEFWEEMLEKIKEEVQDPEVTPL